MGSRMHAETQEPRIVTSISSGREVTWNSPGNTLTIHDWLALSKNRPPLAALTACSPSWDARFCGVALTLPSDRWFGPLASGPGATPAAIPNARYRDSRPE